MMAYYLQGKGTNVTKFYSVGVKKNKYLCSWTSSVTEWQNSFLVCYVLGSTPPHREKEGEEIGRSLYL